MAVSAHASKVRYIFLGKQFYYPSLEMVISTHRVAFVSEVMMVALLCRKIWKCKGIPRSSTDLFFISCFEKTANLAGSPLCDSADDASGIPSQSAATHLRCVYSGWWLKQERGRAQCVIGHEAWVAFVLVPPDALQMWCWHISHLQLCRVVPHTHISLLVPNVFFFFFCNLKLSER